MLKSVLPLTEASYLCHVEQSIDETGGLESRELISWDDDVRATAIHVEKIVSETV